MASAKDFYYKDLTKEKEVTKIVSMVKILRKIFIKNYEDVQNEKVREKHGVLASLVGIVFNTLLFLMKLIIGIFTSSMSIISDALNNMTDFGSSIVSLIGFKLAGKKADKEHPYGHERIEYITGMITSFIIIIVAALLIYNSITSLISGESGAKFSIWAFIILGVSIFLKLILAYIYRGLGKAINSVALQANKQDSLNDVISTSVVLIASLIQYFFPDLWYLDSSVSLLVALFILYSGLKMVKETASPLIGEIPNEELIHKIISDIKSYEGVLGVHDIMFHSYGPTKTFMTCHVEVDGYHDTFSSHDLIDNIEKEISNRYKILLTIHMDPVDTKNKEIPVLHDIIQKTLQNLNENLSFHDLRVVSGPTHTNVIFDVVVPNDYKESKLELTRALREAIRKENEKYIVVINFDENYID